MVRYFNTPVQTTELNISTGICFTQFRPGTALFLLNYLLRKHSKFSENLENLPNEVNLQTIQDILFFSEFLFKWKLPSGLNLREDQFPNNFQYPEIDLPRAPCNVATLLSASPALFSTRQQ